MEHPTLSRCHGPYPRGLAYCLSRCSCHTHRYLGGSKVSLGLELWECVITRRSGDFRFRNARLPIRWDLLGLAHHPHISMFSATTRRVAQNATRRYISTTSRSSTTSIPRTAVLAGAAIAGTVLGGVALLIPAAHADGTMLDDLTQTMEEKSKYLKAPTPSGERNTLETFAWGSNKCAPPKWVSLYHDADGPL